MSKSIIPIVFAPQTLSHSASSAQDLTNEIRRTFLRTYVDNNGRKVNLAPSLTVQNVNGALLQTNSNNMSRIRTDYYNGWSYFVMIYNDTWGFLKDKVVVFGARTWCDGRSGTAFHLARIAVGAGMQNEMIQMPGTYNTSAGAEYYEIVLNFKTKMYSVYVNGNLVTGPRPMAVGIGAKEMPDDASFNLRFGMNEYPPVSSTVDRSSVYIEDMVLVIDDSPDASESSRLGPVRTHYQPTDSVPDEENWGGKVVEAMNTRIAPVDIVPRSVTSNPNGSAITARFTNPPEGQVIAAQVIVDAFKAPDSNGVVECKTTYGDAVETYTHNPRYRANTRTDYPYDNVQTKPISNPDGSMLDAETLRGITVELKTGSL